MALRSPLLAAISDWIECLELRHQSSTAERILLGVSTRWNDKHLVHHHLLTVARSRWHQRLFLLQYAFSTSRSASGVHCCLTPFAGWTSDPADRTIVAFSWLPTIQLRLPPGDINTSLLHLSVAIRDKLDCLIQVSLSPVVVATDWNEIDQLLQSLQAPTSNPLVQILFSGNQNAVGQVISSLSQHFNRINTQALQDAADRSFLAHVAVSPLGSQAWPMVSLRVEDIAHSRILSCSLQSGSTHRRLPNTANNSTPMRASATISSPSPPISLSPPPTASNCKHRPCLSSLKQPTSSLDPLR